MEEIFHWCEEEFGSLQEQQKRLELGEIRTGERRLGQQGDVDTTTKTLGRVKKHLAELQALLARHKN
ncbi:MAG: hypothetical protein ABSC26_11615 [Stellaceae bacterium]